MRKKSTSPEVLVPQRIRSRRESLGLAAYELAKRVGISPSYMSLIESGGKVPSEPIAKALARALDDDPEIYVAWVHASRYPDVGRHVERLARLERYGSDPRLRGRLRRGEKLDPEDETPSGAFSLGLTEKGGFAEATPEAAVGVEPASGRLKRLLARLGKPGSRAETQELSAVEAMAEETAAFAVDSTSLASIRSLTIPVPLLADGSDPGDEPAQADGLLEVLQLDRRLLPPDVDWGDLFAYRPFEESLERVAGKIELGDIVVLALGAREVHSNRIYGVRHEGKIVLSHLWHHGDALVLVPVSGETVEPVSIPVRDQDELEDRLAGVVVTTIRSWGDVESLRSPAVSTPQRLVSRPRPKPRGRSVRLEGDFLVRDCEWRDNYGWRPIQRPEDLQYLEAHPGTKIRFRLIRDGQVRYVLEMGPEEWREALGDYVDRTSWERNGYIVAITKRREGEYGTEFQDRWAEYVKPCS
jgi:transcriptional regulator with XRE-family HTH domain